METKVSEMSVGQLEELISDVFDRKLATMFDPHYGLELREDFVERMKKQQEAISNGTARLIPFEEVLADLGLTEANLRADSSSRNSIAQSIDA